MSFDTRKAFRDLRASGADEPLADAIVDLVRQASDLPDIGLLATREDVSLVRSELLLVKAEVRADIAEFKAELEVKMARLESRMDRLENRMLLWIAASTAVSAFANGGFQFPAKVLHIG